MIEQVDGTSSQFRYYFAQREAVETVIWLYDVRKARDVNEAVAGKSGNTEPVTDRWIAGSLDR